jgi:hypothetical protein
MAGITVVSAELASAAAVRARSLSLPRAAAAASRSAASRRFLALLTTRVARSAKTSSPATSRTTTTATTKITYMGIKIPVDENGQLTTSCDATVRGIMFDATRSQQPQQPPGADDRGAELLAPPPELAVRGHDQARFVAGDGVGDDADDRVVP